VRSKRLFVTLQSWSCPYSSRAPNSCEWPPGSGVGVADRVSDAREAPLRPAVASWTIEGEDDGCALYRSA